MFSVAGFGRKILTDSVPSVKPSVVSRTSTSGLCIGDSSSCSSFAKLHSNTAIVPTPGPSSASSTSPRDVRTAAMASVLNVLPTSLPYGYLIPAAIFATTGILGVLAWIDARLKTCKPEIQMAATAFNTTVMSQCPALLSHYKPFPFLTNPHVETIFAAKYRASPKIKYMRECLIMKDGGSVSLDWECVDNPEQVQALPDNAPVLILLPGLTGGSGDSYVLYAVERARQHGIRAVVFNSRGTADSPVTTPQFYSASFTGDMRAVVAHVQRKYPQSTLLSAGWSLGANIMVRYLGEEGAATPIKAAVSMCNPFELTISNKNFEKGFNRIYDWNLAAALRRIFSKHELVWNGAKGKLRPDIAMAARTIREFDDAITIHSFGWESVDQYYAMSSSALSVPHVTVPLLCLQALDDPIAPKEAIPYKQLADNPNCVLVSTVTGGHLGWVSGEGSPFGHPWSDEAMMQWLDAVLKQLKAQQQSTSEGGGTRSTAEELVAVGASMPAAAAPVNMASAAATPEDNTQVLHATPGQPSAGIPNSPPPFISLQASSTAGDLPAQHAPSGDTASDSGSAADLMHATVRSRDAGQATGLFSSLVATLSSSRPATSAAGKLVAGAQGLAPASVAVKQQAGDLLSQVTGAMGKAKRQVSPDREALMQFDNLRFGM